MQDTQIWATDGKGVCALMDIPQGESPESAAMLYMGAGYREVVVEAHCDDCTQYGEVEFVEGFALCATHCASATGRDDKQLLRLRRAIEREAGAFAREHAYLIDPTYRAE